MRPPRAVDGMRRRTVRSVRERIDGDDVEELQAVADFELFEVVQADTAFVAGGDFADIFLEVLK